MTTEQMSMRQASKALGLRLIEVRQLIRDGKLDANKVEDGAGGHWSIVAISVQNYLAANGKADRGPTPKKAKAETGSNPGAKPAPAAAPLPAPARKHDRAAPRTDGHRAQPKPELAKLLSGLEEHLARVRSLTDELAKSQAYLEGLRQTQASLRAEIAEMRRQIDGGRPPQREPEPAAPAPAAPEPAAANDRESRGGNNAMAAALADAGLTNDQKPSKASKSPPKAKTEVPPEPARKAKPKPSAKKPEPAKGASKPKAKAKGRSSRA